MDVVRVLRVSCVASLIKAHWEMHAHHRGTQQQTFCRQHSNKAGALGRQRKILSRYLWPSQNWKSTMEKSFYSILLMILSLQQMQAGSQCFWFLMQFTSTVCTQLCGHLSRWNETCRNLFYSEGCVLPSSSVAALALLGLHLPVQPRTVK